MGRQVHSAADFDHETIQAWYGPISPLTPREVGVLLADSGVRWAIAGGRAARVGAAPREHEDTDVELPMSQLDRLRRHLEDWHLWQNIDGALKPLLPADDPAPGAHQFWLRRDSSQPWVADVLLRPGDEHEWVFRRDERIRLPWTQACHIVDEIPYVRPEVALLFKGKSDRPKDRADLAAAALTPAARTWLVENLGLLGHHEWAALAREQRN